MLYELVGIARVNTMKEMREIVKTIGSVVINTGGVVRRADWLGRQYLPKVMSKHQQLHFAGHHFFILFDSSIKAQRDIYELLKVDPRMIRVMTVNVSKNLPQLTMSRPKPPMV
ncbi:hypothetical protein V1512DRAFT_258266 [Lipomyces arxii]|uniref:mitochondrial 37S ribosomal protein bS6m n=1 Tax=Lipomyces arxii TaxID=56418 RepID=UPI0034CFB7F1